MSKFRNLKCKLKLSNGNLAYVMIMLFINIKLLMIDNYHSKGFPGQLHEALCKCFGMIFVLRVNAKDAQLVQYVTFNDRLFFFSGNRGFEFRCVLIFFL